MRTELIVVILAVVLIAGALLFVPLQPTVPKAKQFASYAELASFIKERSEGYYGGGVMMRDQMVGAPMATMATGAEAATQPKATEYSETNIQVIGVDEPDIVKNDGKYIYTVSQNRIFIVDAYPADSANVTSQIDINNTYISNIFVNGNRLVVFGSGQGFYPMTETAVAAPAVSKVSTEIAVAPGYGYYPYTGKSVIYVYDITDRSSPVLVRNVSVDGSYYDARMIGDYVYAVTTQPVQILDSGPILPVYAVGAKETTVAATDITYFDTYDTSFVYTSIMALNTQNDAEEPNEKVFLFGYSQSLYVSPENIYTVYTKTLSYTEYYNRLVDQAIIPNVPSSVVDQIAAIRNNQSMTSYEKLDAIGRVVNDYAQSLGPENGATFMKNIEDKAQQVIAELQKEMEKTVVNKIGISGSSIEYKTSGDVPGRVLNQFSMDEYNGNFRIATTTGNSWDNTSLNHVYVLDSSLGLIGSAENLARGEQIYSARFMGDRAYLVTFKRTDPLFVIDLSNPSAPTVLGELKMPGFSEYLHPYDEGHLIGVGQETDESGRSTHQLKLSLFDVSDVSNPKELSTYLIGSINDYTYSEALYDHKAFLFSKSKNLLVIPVSMNNWNENKYSQGAYVFDLTLENGFSLKGQITHVIENASENEWYYDYTSAVKRALYMDTTLYTVSDKMIKANSLLDLSEIAKVNLTQEVSGIPVP